MPRCVCTIFARDTILVLDSNDFDGSFDGNCWIDCRITLLMQMYAFTKHQMKMRRQKRNENILKTKNKNKQSIVSRFVKHKSLDPPYWFFGVSFNTHTIHTHGIRAYCVGNSYWCLTSRRQEIFLWIKIQWRSSPIDCIVHSCITLHLNQFAVHSSWIKSCCMGYSLDILVLKWNFRAQIKWRKWKIKKCTEDKEVVARRE